MADHTDIRVDPEVVYGQSSALFGRARPSTICCVSGLVSVSHIVVKTQL